MPKLKRIAERLLIADAKLIVKGGEVVGFITSKTAPFKKARLAGKKVFRKAKLSQKELSGLLKESKQSKRKILKKKKFFK